MAESQRYRLEVGYNGREFCFDFPKDSSTDSQFTIRLEDAAEGLCAVVIKVNGESAAVACKFDAKSAERADELRFVQAMESFRDKRHPDLQKLLCENRLLLEPGKRYELPLLPTEDYTFMRGLSFDLWLTHTKRKRRQENSQEPVEDFAEQTEPLPKRVQAPPPMSRDLLPQRKLLEQCP